MSNFRIHLALLATAALLAADNGYNLFQRGLAKERADADPRAAIRIYQQVLQDKSIDRKLAAQALLRMAECHQKLGDAEARKIYERVVREYSDQKEPVQQARIRLMALQPKPNEHAIVNRRVWTLPDRGDIFGTASPDGRYVPYVDWAKFGDLYLHDLVAGTDRQLTTGATDGKPGIGKSEEQYAEEYAFSRDGKRLAYSWFRGDIDRYELRVLLLPSNDVPAFRTLLSNEDISWIGPHDWSPDAKWIAVQLHRKDKSAQIGLVSTEDGKLRVLKSIDWRGASGLFFSTDGKYLAYDLPAGESEQQRDIYAIAVDGSREFPLVVHPSHDSLLGWSPDGTQLLFASDRSGSMGLWSQSVADGRAQGSPELIKPGIGEFVNMGISSVGALHYVVQTSLLGGDIQTATFDFSKCAFVSPPVQAVSSYVGTNNLPDWSPDGKYLAYSSRRRSVGSSYFIVGIREMESGTVREIVPMPNFQHFLALSWSRDGKSLLIGGRDAKGRNGVFRMNAQTGQTSMIVEKKGAARIAMESPDGRSLYYLGMAPDGDRAAYYRRDLASGEETILLRMPNPAYGSLSPDGRYLAVNNAVVPREPRGVLLVPTSGGETREVIHVDAPQRAFFFAWTPDGRSLLAQKHLDNQAVEMWKVPLDGSESTKLELKTAADVRNPLKVHPDGRQVVLQVPVPRKPEQIWALENFLTASK